MTFVRSSEEWLSYTTSPRAAEMRVKLRGIEINIVAAKRRAKAFPSNEADAEIEKLKMAAGRIRAHLRRGVYG